MLKAITFGPAMSTTNSTEIPAFEDMVLREVGEKTPGQQSLVVKREQTCLGKRNLTAPLSSWTYLWGSQEVLPHGGHLSQ